MARLSQASGTYSGFWARRYTSIVVNDEESAQVERLRYTLAHGVKENLVEKVLDWPGVHAARILEDKPLTGYWFDRTQEYAARNRGEEYGRLSYATEETFVLTRLPCFLKPLEPVQLPCSAPCSAPLFSSLFSSPTQKLGQQASRSWRG